MKTRSISPAYTVEVMEEEYKPVNAPYMVRVPHRDGYINLAPLFVTIHKYYEDDYQELIKALERVIRTIALTPNPELTRQEESDALYDLYLIRDTLEDVFQCRQPRNTGSQLNRGRS